MIVKIHDDGKEMIYSVEAYADSPLIVGMGRTQEEAIKELKKVVTALMAELQSLDYSKTERVDWKGDPLPEVKK